MARKKIGRDAAIDFTRVERMSFRRFVYLRIDSEVEIVLEDGVLKLHRGWNADPEGAIPMIPEVAERLTRLFNDCSVGGWKRRYEPDGNMVCDGEGWELALKFDDGSALEYEGSNAWPENYEELEEGLVGLFGSPN